MNGEGTALEPLSVPLTAPLSWRDGIELQGPEAGAAAVRALATAVSLAERPPLVNEEALGMELEVARLHQKTQLLIELLALALARDVTRPQPTLLQLSALGCCWRTTHAPVRDGRGVVSIWLHPAAPEPMSWPAQIVELEVQAGGQVLVHARFLPLGELAQAALERHIFQLHRRAIAEAKSRS